MYFIGFFIDLIIRWDLIPMQTELTGQLGLLLFSVMVLGVASLFYLRVQLGAGPRDCLTIGLVKKLDKPVAYVRGTIEVTVLILGHGWTHGHRDCGDRFDCWVFRAVLLQTEALRW